MCKSDGFHWAAATRSNDMNLADHLNISRMLGYAWVDPNGRTDGYVHSRKKTIGQEDTPLHTAAVGNMAAAVKTLLDIGCDPTVTNAKGEVHLAAARLVHLDDEITSLLTYLLRGVVVLPSHHPHDFKTGDRAAGPQ